MENHQIQLLINKKEGTTLEFKKADTDVPTTLWESVCSMLNTNGGEILLGINDNGDITGVHPNCVDNMLRSIVNQSNDPSIISPPYLLSPEKVLIDGQWIIYIHIPSSSQVHRCKRTYYKRMEDADFKVENHNDIEDLYRRKSSTYSESKIYPFLAFTDFNTKAIAKARAILKSNRPNHPWNGMSDEELFLSARLYRTDYITGQKGYTLAAALLFGQDNVIKSILPAYNIDAMVRVNDVDRYDDRLLIETNLIDSYTLLSEFVEKHLPNPFVLNKDKRIDLRDIIFREVIANLVIHREYVSPSPCTFIIYKDRVETKNANRPHGHGPINPESVEPYYKNPDIGEFFNKIGIVERIGSGIRNVSKYIEDYAGKGQKAEFVEDDIFRMTIPRPLAQNIVSTPYHPVREIDGIYIQMSKNAYINANGSVPTDKLIGKAATVLEIIANTYGLSRNGIKERYNISMPTLERILKILIKDDLIKAKGAGSKTRIYQVTEKTKNSLKHIDGTNTAN